MSNIKTYGPYMNNKGRLFVIHWDGIKRITQSYPRYLMEKKLGRSLKLEEQVDHINENYLSNKLCNLQILLQKENIEKSIVRGNKYYKFICPICNKESKKLFRNVLHNWKRGTSGPFCSRICGRKFQLAPISQQAEEIDLKSIRFGFKSQSEHQYITKGEIIII